MCLLLITGLFTGCGVSKTMNNNINSVNQSANKSNEEVACLYYFMGESEAEINIDTNNGERLTAIDNEYFKTWNSEVEKEGISITANEFCDSYLDYNYIAENLKNCFTEYDSLSEQKRNEVNNYTADKEEEEILNLEGDEENLAIAQNMIGCKGVIMNRFDEQRQDKIIDKLQETNYSLPI